MVADPTKPTREQLGAVAGRDFRLIRALERLFEVAGTENPEAIVELQSRMDSVQTQTAAALSTTFLSNALRGLLRGNLVFVSDWTDFPKPVSGVITLRDNFTYYVTKEVDLQGNYILGGQNTSINGGSSENSRLKSTGLSASIGLLTSEWSITLRDLTLDGVSGGKLLDLDATGNANQALDWRNVNFENTDNIGTIAGYNNFVGETLGILGAAGWVFDGTVGTIAFANTLFSGTSTGTIITVPATAVISRRFRVIYSAVVVPTGGTGFNVSASASIPVEGYIFDTCNFSGGGTYLNGIDYTYNEARFTESRGIVNTAVIASYSMSGNATPTLNSGVAVGADLKVAGTTIPGGISQKFDNSTSNSALYQGAIDRVVEVEGILSLSSGNNNSISIYIAKNDVKIPASEVKATTDAGGLLENGSTSEFVSVSDGDTLSVRVANNSFSNDITVENMKVNIKRVG